jgi:hypothetical protein
MGTASVVGLLTAPLSLARVPLHLTLRVWEVGLSTAAEAARIGMELLGPDRSVSDFADYRAPSHPGYGGNGQPTAPPVVADAPPVVADAPPVVADAPPAVPDELIPDHVDEEVVLVAEVAEEGAEDGAGPELHVNPPWDGYDQMTAADIRDRLSAATAVEAAAVELYEATGKSRRTVLDAAERALKR